MIRYSSDLTGYSMSILLSPNLAQIPPVPVEIPWWLQLFAVVGLLAVGIWMFVLVRHAAWEEREFNASQAKDDAGPQ